MEIPFHKVGTHRRVKREDMLEYKARQLQEAEEAMQNLIDQAQELLPRLQMEGNKVGK